MKVFSFGGGVQSMAAMVLAAQGRLDYQTFVMVNVGDDSEHPGTVEYLHNVAIPYAAAHGLTLEVISKVNRAGEPVTLYQKLLNSQRSIDIPARMSGNGAPGNRNCTGEFKVKPIQRWTKKNGATAEAPAMVGVGISVDEWTRMKSDSGCAWQVLDYPLVQMGIDRAECERIIADAGLPVPPKSSCWFCPYHDEKSWERLYDENHGLFVKAVMLERTINARRRELGKDEVWFTRWLRPLDQVFDGNHQRRLSLFDLPPEAEHSCGPFACTTDGRIA